MFETIQVWQLILIVPICLIVLLAFVAFGIRIVKVIKLNNKGKKKDVSSIDYSSFFGGKENILGACVDGERISIEVKDVSLCNLEGLKEHGAKNIMIVGNVIKASFENAKDVCGGLK